MGQADGMTQLVLSCVNNSLKTVAIAFIQEIKSVQVDRHALNLVGQSIGLSFSQTSCLRLLVRIIRRQNVRLIGILYKDKAENSRCIPVGNGCLIGLTEGRIAAFYVDIGTIGRPTSSRIGTIVIRLQALKPLRYIPNTFP